MMISGIPSLVPDQKRHGFAPQTRIGRWAVALVVAALGVAVAMVTVVPDDSIQAWVGLVAGLALIVSGATTTFIAIVRRGERALMVRGAAFVLVAGVLFVLLHSLFISD